MGGIILTGHAGAHFGFGVGTDVVASVAGFDEFEPVGVW